MIPLLLALIFFVHFAVVGRATFALLGLRFGHVRTWLLAPTLGLAVTGLIIMVPNQAGVPMAAYARPLIIIVTLGALGVLVRCRLVPPKGLGSFGLLAAGALLLGGWPALVHGLNWVSYGNDDMTNYCLGAERFLRHGFYDIPTLQDLAGGDYAQYFWMMHVVGMIRFGSEHMVALAAGATGLGTVQVFMPVILAFSLTQLWAILGLALTRPARRRTTLLTGILLMIAPLWYFGTMYQLIAQVCGLALLATLLTLTARTRFPRGFATRLRFATGCALLIAGLCIFYPEVIPFFVLGWGLFLILRLLQLRHWIKGLVPVLSLTAVVVGLLLRHNIVSTTITLLSQTQEGMDVRYTAERISLFPYFLTPTGPAYLFGFDVIVAAYEGLPAALGLLGGFAAGLVALWAAGRGLAGRTPPGALLAIMLLIGAQLFSTNNGFGLFKLCMFALPFLLIEIARLGNTPRGRQIWVAVFCVLLVTWLPGVWRYTEAAQPGSASGVRELFDASISRGLLPEHPTTVWAVTTASPVNKLLMLEQPAGAPAFISQLINATILGRAENPYADWIWHLLPGKGDFAAARRVVGFVKNQVYPQERIHGLSFWRRTGTEESAPDPATAIVTSSAELRSFNKLNAPAYPATPGLFTHTTLGQLANHLAFIQSTAGQHYYLGATGHIAVYKPQPDIYLPHEYFFVVGRHLLFRVLNPTTTVRLRFSLTSSILGAGRTQLPEQATVSNGAASPLNLGLVGAGSANVFSPPLQLTELHGVPYLALDLGRPPLHIGLPHPGLQGIYNRTITTDSRLGLGYCRDLSLVSEADYAAQPRPRTLSRFPADLFGPAAVEYSGLYEDGWVSDHAFAVLGPVNPHDKITVQAMLPLIPGPKPAAMHVELLADGVSLLAQEVTPGHFTLEAPLPSAGRQVKIELRFDRTETLPAPDNRPVTVLLEALKITSAP